MKPRNKYEEHIYGMHKMLSPISQKQQEHAIKVCFEHQAWCSGKHTYCMECGKELTADEIKHHKCSCGFKLKTINTLKRKVEEVSYYAIVDRCNDFQVIRYFCVIRQMLKKHPTIYTFIETAQIWIDNNLKVTYITKYPSFSWYNRYGFSLSSDMEIRKTCSIRENFVWEHAELIDILKQRLGTIKNFNRNIGHNNIYDTIMYVCYNSKYETLYKAGYYKFLDNYIRCLLIDKYWKQICICIRHHYKISDVSTWFDLLGSLEFLGLDINNPKYICPDNLNYAHDHYLKKQKKIQEEREKQETLKRISKYEPIYKQNKSKFFSLIIKNNNITITPIKSVMDVYIEGKTMHHCVFAAKYYEKKNSLIMSVVNNNNERIATVEYDITNNNVIQCQGKFNHTPERYDEIINLINDNKKQIMKYEKTRNNQ